MAARKTTKNTPATIDAAPKSKALATAGGKDIALIDAELASEVANLKEQIGAPTGNRIRIEAAGRFTMPDGGDLGNEIKAIVVDFINRNNFYLSQYNPNAITPPDCYAIGKVIATMSPEADSPAVQNPKCGTCPQNAFGSAANGKAKACQNRYYLAVLLVDENNPDAHNEPDAPLYLLDISPSNRKPFEGFAAGVQRALNGPPIKAIVTITAENVGTYAALSFIDVMPNPDYGQHVARRAEAEAILTRKPDFAAYEAQAPQARGAAARGAAPRRGAAQPARGAARR